MSSKVLVSTLQPGDIVIMDAIRSAGARLFFLPKYSPDRNPIERLFAKLKHLLRKAAQRTTEAVCTAIAHILETVTPRECRNYFADAGYDRTQNHTALAARLYAVE